MDKIITIFLVSICGAKIIEGFDSDCALAPAGVYVSFSSEAEIFEIENNDRSVLRWIDISWWGMDASLPDDIVALFDHQPTAADIGSQSDGTYIDTVDGKYQTIVRWNSTEFPSDIESAKGCMSLWAAYIDSGSNDIKYSSCLKFEPLWMNENREYIEGVGIADVLLPGSHDAGAYDGIHLLGGNEVSKWTFTQDEALWQQFVMGVRYVDMRISYYNNTEEKFWVNHGTVRIRPLDGYLEDTVRFLSESEEILIFDIHEFSTGYDNATSQMLVELLEDKFGSFMAPASMGLNPTLGELWATNKTLIVTYPHDSDSELLWENVQHVWGNVNELDDLYSYMNESIPIYTGKGEMWSCMVEFTPSSIDVGLNRWNGLRGAANVTNEPVTQWVRREWWTSSNIVAMDYVGASGIVDVIIEANIMRNICAITA